MLLVRLAAALVLCLGIANADSFSFTGTFSQDDQLEVFLFSGASSSVVLRTWSYAGGTNAAGTLIPAGGFDPFLSLFDATGGLSASSPLIGLNDNGAGVDTDGSTGNGFDSLLSLTTLDPGKTYALVLSEVDNEASGPTFGDGFSQQGNGNFTPGEFGCAATAFCDSTPAARSGAWALDIAGVRLAEDATNPSSVPEPGMLWILAAGIGGIALRRNRPRSS